MCEVPDQTVVVDWLYPAIKTGIVYVQSLMVDGSLALPYAADLGPATFEFLSSAYVRYGRRLSIHDEWPTDYVSKLMRTRPRAALDVILPALEDPSVTDTDLYFIAAGDLEVLVNNHYDEVESRLVQACQQSTRALLAVSSLYLSHDIGARLASAVDPRRP